MFRSPRGVSEVICLNQRLWDRRAQSLKCQSGECPLPSWAGGHRDQGQGEGQVLKLGPWLGGAWICLQPGTIYWDPPCSTSRQCTPITAVKRPSKCPPMEPSRGPTNLQTQARPGQTGREADLRVLGAPGTRSWPKREPRMRTPCLWEKTLTQP